MPLFEFNCQSCNHEFEELLLTASPANEAVSCPACGSKTVTKKLSVFSNAAATSDPAPASLPAGGCGRCGNPYASCSLG